MAQVNLLEAYGKKLALSEQVYAKNHNGVTMPGSVKLATARCIQNANAFLNESLSGDSATQFGDMKTLKAFCTTIATITVPSLIATSLVKTVPMTSQHGVIAYPVIVAGSNKGGVARGDLVNSPFALGNIDKDYSGSRVAETITLDSNKSAKLAWSPVLLTSDNKLLAGFDKDGKEIAVKLMKDTTEYAYTATADGTITVSTSSAAENDELKVGYIYDNAYIPANDIPTIAVKMEQIPLFAKIRRLAVYFSQLAAFQSKMDYGIDLKEMLSTQAVAEIQYEIDTEVCTMLAEAAPADSTLSFSKAVQGTNAISVAQHYADFATVIYAARSAVYKRTKKYSPNWMLCAVDVMEIMNFVPGFHAAPASVMAGPYFAGEVGGLKVFVSAALEDGTFVFGCNSPELNASCGVFAPYMPIIPTMLVEGPDGGNTQGFATMYDCKVINPLLLVKGKVTA